MKRETRNMKTLAGRFVGDDGGEGVGEVGVAVGVHVLAVEEVAVFGLELEREQIAGGEEGDVVGLGDRFGEREKLIVVGFRQRLARYGGNG